jgi:dihydrofolate reductase
MGRIVSNFFVSLDGVVESPNLWHFPYFDDAMGEVVGSGMATTKAWLMGRRLYDEWSEFWPQQGPEVPFSGFINGVPKYVVSSSLTDPSWSGTTVVPGDVAAVQRVKDSVDGDIGMSGSATTVRWLLANGLLDELALLVHPIVVGHGQRLYESADTAPLALVHQSTLPTGVLHLRYAPATPGA